jgi:polyhydroxyalkanoate synthesis repressor PhaR
MDGPLVYKKYANRRIYDTGNSRYVTLDEVADAIRRGREVQIIDAKTKADVTAFILTQIVLEQAKRNNALLPVLHLIIQYGDNLLLEFFDTYLQQIVRNYIRYKSAVDKQFKRWLDLGMGLSGMGPGVGADPRPFNAFFRATTSADKDDE